MPDDKKKKKGTELIDELLPGERVYADAVPDLPANSRVIYKPTQVFEPRQPEYEIEFGKGEMYDPRIEKRDSLFALRDAQRAARGEEPAPAEMPPMMMEDYPGAGPRPLDPNVRAAMVSAARRSYMQSRGQAPGQPLDPRSYNDLINALEDDRLAREGSYGVSSPAQEIPRQQFIGLNQPRQPKPPTGIETVRVPSGAIMEKEAVRRHLARKVNWKQTPSSWLDEIISKSKGK